VVTLTDLLIFLRDSAADVRRLPFADMQFWHRDAANLLAVSLLGLCVVALAVRYARRRRSRRDRVALPALLPSMRRSPVAFVRHGAVLPFLAGVPFFVIALADPYTAFTREEATFPGRRIALMIDASSSMLAPFRAETLNPAGGSERANAFHTSVAAAENFVRRRMQGKYRDLMGLIEFGNEAYVITPFTHDYDNILLSIALIGDPAEWRRFPDQGTLIGPAVNEGVDLFRAFEFEKAAGNVIVVFSDGLDSDIVNGTSADTILKTAIETKIPVYMIRVADESRLGRDNPDRQWAVAVAKTGGRFYPAAGESTILQAIDDIDRASVGEISVARYSTQESRFTPFAAVAVMLWSLAALMKLTVPHFSKFP
jgi:Ca-activated chloride channel family protein